MDRLVESLFWLSLPKVVRNGYVEGKITNGFEEFGDQRECGGNGDTEEQA